MLIKENIFLNEQRRYNKRNRLTTKFICVFLFIIILGCEKVCSQVVEYSGVVSDSLTGEFLSGAVVLESNTNNATTTNQYGFFSIGIEADSAEFEVRYVGYIPKEYSCRSLVDSVIDISLNSSNKLSEVIVFGNQAMQKVSGSSEISLPLNLIKKMPALLGEPDLLKSIQRFPGVQTGVEGTSGIYVRGGSPDQNLILIDEVPVYNVGHLLGFFSVFNSDAIRSTTFIKGGLPARYGGRLSSVIDVKVKEGNLKQQNIKGSIGLLSTQIMVEAPIVKEKLGFMIAARRSFYDVVFSPIVKVTTGTSAGYFFYDINGSMQYRVNKKNSIFYSLYNGKDKGHVTLDISPEFAEKNQLKWGNHIQTIRWNHIFNNNIFSNLTIAYSNYAYSSSRSIHKIPFSILTPEIVNQQSYFASIDDYSIKYRFEQTNLKNHQLGYGLGVSYHMYKPGETSLFSSSYTIDTTIIARNISAIEFSAFFEDIVSVTDKFKINLGVHSSSFLVDDTTYYSIEPRVSFLYKLGQHNSLKGSYTKSTQYIGLLTSSGVGLPTDLWIPSTRKIPPQRAVQYVLGYHHNTKWINLSTEIFYKEMRGLVEFSEGASFLLGRTDWDELISTGHGEAYGIEFLAEKNFGKVSGWISYTLSKNQRHFIDIDPSFPYKYDRRHNLSISGVYNFSTKRNISASWIFYSGENITISNIRYLSHPALVTGYYQENSVLPGLSTIEAFTERNNFKMTPYHRLDIGYSKSKMKENKKIVWRFGVYNAYSHMNTFYTIMLENDKKEVNLVKLSFAPIMPYFRYEFNF